MQASTRAFIKRGGAVCAAAVVLIGGTFTAGAATASPSQDIEPSSISSAVATATATSTAPATDAALPVGMAEAVERDLDITLEEFNKRSALALEAGKIKEKLTEKDSSAAVTLDGDTINVTTTDPAAAETAAADTEVNIASPEAPASTADAADQAAPVPAESVEKLLTDYIAEFGSSKLQSIMRNAAGEFVIRTGEPATGGPAMSRQAAPATETPLSKFAENYGNVTIVAASGPASPFIDVVNGQGYATPVEGGFGLCSIGFTGFNDRGDDAVITAGHCTDDGNATETLLTDPTLDDAAGGTDPGPLAPLGSFGDSQFGGPGNTPNVPGTDVAVIDVPDVPEVPELALNLLPKVTDWTTPADPKASGPLVTGVSDAVVGTPICKSGRTTGWTCGTVEGVGFFSVAGRNFPATEENPDICKPPGGLTVPGCDDIRIVNGFGTTNMRAIQGDSGGAIVSGTTAVGMISAGIANVVTYGVSLTDALSKTAGYTVRLSLSTPTINTTSAVYRGGAFTGTVPGAPAGTTVEVTINGTAATAPVAADGTWSVPAPSGFATYAVTATAINGFNKSETATASVAVIKQTLPVPAITAPANEGTVAAPVDAINGTGTAGATVAVEIADDDAETDNITGTAVVGADGNWSVPVAPGLAVGNYTATALQTQADWIDSPTATSTFAVVYSAPAIVSPANGAEFAFNEGPAEITGTNVDGAAVAVTVNGTSYNAVVTDTTWTVALNAPLGSGAYTVTAVQSLNGVTSLVAESSFTVLAAPAPAPVEMDLANTGTSGTTVLLAIAGGLVLLGGAAFLLIRRRSTN